MSKGELLFKSSDAGELTVKCEEVADLSTDELLKASLKNGETLIGKIRAGRDNALTLEPDHGNPAVALHMSQITAVQQPREPVGWDLDFHISGGISEEIGDSTTKKCVMTSDLKIFKMSDIINSENWAVRTHTGIRVPIFRKFVGSFQSNDEYDNQMPEVKTQEERPWKFGLAWAF